jgi:tetratricopeptide (TPR) repeat protein
VVTLINARFVPLYFDLGAGSPAADVEAKKFVIAIDPRLGGASVPTPEVFVVHPDGKLLGRESNYATEDAYLAMLQEVVATEASLLAETQAERELAAPDRAWLRYCLGDTGGAFALLEDEADDASLLMLAQLNRHEQQLDRVRELLAKCSDTASAAVAMEVGLLAMAQRDHARALAAFESIAHDHPRASEAEYQRGLALYHLQYQEAAHAVWTRLIQRHGEDRWSYRADWALQGVSTGEATQFSTSGPRSALGRHGYMGRDNPDLESRPVGARSKAEFLEYAGQRLGSDTDFLEALFEAVDKDQDGWVSEAEFADRRTALQALQSVADVDPNAPDSSSELKTDYEQHSRRAAARDAFPVFDEPELVMAAEASLSDEEAVIGVVVGGEARAYPVSVMGVHELGNDVCGGVPIAVSW